MTTAAAPGDTARITVSPDTFTAVTFEASAIVAIVGELADLLGITNPIHVEVDETTPMTRMWASLDGSSSDATITIKVESGAIEDRRHVRRFGPDTAREALGRMLLRARDRLGDDFDAPDDGDLDIRQQAAWNAYAAGRLSRLGLPVNQQRWRYNYRNRFGFTDESDAAFDRLWAADDLPLAQVLAP